MPEPGPTTGTLPFVVIGGYLGAGKTTLVNRLLTDGSAGRVAVLVNDFGDVNIDTSLIERHDGETISLANGCVCCSLVDGFVLALDRVRGMAADLDRVIVEVSGVGDPWKVAQWGRTPGFELDAVLTLVDVSTILELADDRRVGDTVRRQIEGADIIVLTKTDLIERQPAAEVRRRVDSPCDTSVIDGQRTAEVRSWIASASDSLVIDGSNWTGLVDTIIGPGRSNTPSAAPAVEPEADHALHVIASRTFDSPVERPNLEALIASRPDGVMRVKGHVRVVAEPPQIVRVQVVGHRVEITVVKDPADEIQIILVAVATDQVSAADLQGWLDSNPFD